MKNEDENSNSVDKSALTVRKLHWNEQCREICYNIFSEYIFLLLIRNWITILFINQLDYT